SIAIIALHACLQPLHAVKAKSAPFFRRLTLDFGRMSVVSNVTIAKSMPKSWLLCKSDANLLLFGGMAKISGEKNHRSHCG
ncbi:MAG: hypothetical protein IJ724_10810, partial [Muribaculaceae bacterium]|nr:hypothetical protein [Muribaculaceae bacterium]